MRHCWVSARASSFEPHIPPQDKANTYVSLEQDSSPEPEPEWYTKHNSRMVARNKGQSELEAMEQQAGVAIANASPSRASIQRSRLESRRLLLKPEIQLSRTMVFVLSSWRIGNLELTVAVSKSGTMRILLHSPDKFCGLKPSRRSRPPYPVSRIAGARRHQASRHHNWSRHPCAPARCSASPGWPTVCR